MPAFLSAAQLTILAPELLHLLEFAQEHFRFGLKAHLRCKVRKCPLWIKLV
jgi:hypothetical protein